LYFSNNYYLFIYLFLLNIFFIFNQDDYFDEDFDSSENNLIKNENKGIYKLLKKKILF